MIADRLVLSVTVALSLGAGVQVAGMRAAAGEASDKASCMGIESSAISPPGSSDEFPGGRAAAEKFIQDLARQLGVPPGAIVSSFAHVHAGSHEACDEGG